MQAVRTVHHRASEGAAEAYEIKVGVDLALRLWRLPIIPQQLPWIVISGIGGYGARDAAPIR
jgi:hypothetical protein